MRLFYVINFGLATAVAADHTLSIIARDLDDVLFLTNVLEKRGACLGCLGFRKDKAKDKQRTSPAPSAGTSGSDGSGRRLNNAGPSSLRISHSTSPSGTPPPSGYESPSSSRQSSGRFPGLSRVSSQYSSEIRPDVPTNRRTSSMDVHPGSGTSQRPKDHDYHAREGVGTSGIKASGVSKGVTQATKDFKDAAMGRAENKPSEVQMGAALTMENVANINRQYGLVRHTSSSLDSLPPNHRIASSHGDPPRNPLQRRGTPSKGGSSSGGGSPPRGGNPSRGGGSDRPSERPNNSPQPGRTGAGPSSSGQSRPAASNQHDSQQRIGQGIPHREPFDMFAGQHRPPAPPTGVSFNQPQFSAVSPATMKAASETVARMDRQTRDRPRHPGMRPSITIVRESPSSSRSSSPEPDSPKSKKTWSPRDKDPPPPPSQ